MFDHPFTMRELTSVIKSFKKRSSPGLDRIDYSIIDDLPEKYLLILLNIFNDYCWIRACFPGAFDNVIPNILISDLIRIDLPPKI